MNHKPLFLAVTLVALLVIGGVFWVMEKRQGSVNSPVAKDTVQDDQRTKPDEIESIKDLIDGEYAFTPVDTSDWQIYRNDEAGFEVKIPKNWEMRELYREEDKGIYLWFSQKGKWYDFENGKQNAIVVSISFRSNPLLRSSEDILKLWKNYYNISIKKLTVNDVPLYFHAGFGEGINTTASFPKDYSFSISSNLVLDGYPDVREVLHGMIQSLKFW